MIKALTTLTSEYERIMNFNRLQDSAANRKKAKAFSSRFGYN